LSCSAGIRSSGPGSAGIFSERSARMLATTLACEFGPHGGSRLADRALQACRCYVQPRQPRDRDVHFGWRRRLSAWRLRLTAGIL
jgi:hypothetical protein